MSDSLSLWLVISHLRLECLLVTNSKTEKWLEKKQNKTKYLQQEGALSLAQRLLMDSWLHPHGLSHHLSPPPVHHFNTKHISPSTVTLSTDSCRLLPLRTTFTVCHSLSFSFCPANSVSGPLPVVGDGERIQNHKWHSGIAVRTTYVRARTHARTPTHRHSSHTAGDSARGENLHVFRNTFTLLNIPVYCKNGNDQIFGLTDCKFERLLQSS